MVRSISQAVNAAQTKKSEMLVNEVIETLLYFDIFHYPLTRQEVFSFLHLEHCSQEEVTQVLTDLVSAQHIFQYNEFYCITNNPANIHRRLKGNEMAARLTPVALRQAKLIASFPFVVSVLATGSFSKGYMDDQSDLDFFIITRPNRMWIARMMLVLYKRIFLRNSHRLFCVNYFVDSDHLEIEEKNRFTATEFITAIPLVGEKCYQAFRMSNEWAMRFFPNAGQPPKAIPLHASKRKRIVEAMFERLGATHLNTLFMIMTRRRWERIYRKQYSADDFHIAFKTNHHTSKNHPKHYQKKVIELLEERKQEFFSTQNLSGL